jgi:E3 SUMO-protein ligase PIAS1
VRKTRSSFIREGIIADTHRVASAFRFLKDTKDLNTYAKLRYQCEQLGAPVKNFNIMPAPTFGGSAQAAGPSRGHNAYAGPYGGESHVFVGAIALADVTSGARQPPPNSYQPLNASGPSRQNGGWTPTNVATHHVTRPPILQDWKPNPMWKPIKALTNMESLPDIGPNEQSSVRRERRINMMLNQEVIDKLNDSRWVPHTSDRG